MGFQLQRGLGPFSLVVDTLKSDTPLYSKTSGCAYQAYFALDSYYRGGGRAVVRRGCDSDDLLLDRTATAVNGSHATPL